ncbi:MAG: hypothetical protein WKF36_12040 [Candidatus Nitrosocosmicus sp.]
MIDKILKIYKESIAKVPILNYSSVLITTICILTLIAYFKLNNLTVFIYAIAVLVVTLICFAFSYLIKVKDNYSKGLLYAITTPFVLIIAISVLGFGSFIIFGKPKFYKRWFPDERDIPKDTARKNNDNFKIEDNQEDSKTTKSDITSKNNNKKKGEERTITMSIQLTQNSGGYLQLYLDGKRLNPLPESTTYNPRIEVKNYKGSGLLLILTKAGDSCWTSLPDKNSSNLFRIVPSCL